MPRYPCLTHIASIATEASQILYQLVLSIRPVVSTLRVHLPSPADPFQLKLHGFGAFLSPYVSAFGRAVRHRYLGTRYLRMFGSRLKHSFHPKFGNTILEVDLGGHHILLVVCRRLPPQQGFARVLGSISTLISYTGLEGWQMAFLCRLLKLTCIKCNATRGKF